MIAIRHICLGYINYSFNISLVITSCRKVEKWEHYLAQSYSIKEIECFFVRELTGVLQRYLVNNLHFTPLSLQQKFYDDSFRISKSLKNSSSCVFLQSLINPILLLRVYWIMLFQILFLQKLFLHIWYTHVNEIYHFFDTSQLPNMFWKQNYSIKILTKNSALA